MSNKKATLNIDGKEPIDIKIFKPVLGNSCISAIDIAKSGYFILDEGYTATASCESKITYIDGLKGILLHGGYPIEQLASNSEYLEVCYLLLNGELPNAQQYQEYKDNIKKYNHLNNNIANFYSGFSRDAHPMSMLSAVVAALSSFYNDTLDIHSSENRDITINRIVAKMPILVAMTYKYSIGEAFIQPDTNSSFAHNFLNMMFSKQGENLDLNPVIVKAMDTILTLHADHEQNASTSTVRMSGSTGCSPYVAISTGISALWGPLHGGANEAVIRMLSEIGTIDNVDSAVTRAKDKNDSFRLMGFGHRVYKNFDPRSKVIKAVCDSLLAELKIDDPLLDIAKKLEAIALKDSYFIERNLYPNVDFYSGIVLRAIGIPLPMFTTIFALGRTIGWLAHWKEMQENKNKLCRPRQLYTGFGKRDYIDLSNR